MNKQEGLVPFVIVILVALVIGGYLIYQKQFKSTSVPQTAKSIPAPTFPAFIYKQPTYLVSSSPTPAVSPELLPFNPGQIDGWKTYSTHGVFNLLQETIENNPSLYHGNIKVQYPENWILSEGKPPKEEVKCGLLLGVGLSKFDPNIPNEGEAPPDNSAYIMFWIKATNSAPNKLVSDVLENHFCPGATGGGKPVYDQDFNGYKAAYITTGRKIPHEIVFSVSPTTMMVIDIDFYDNHKNKPYSDETTEEIQKILSSIHIE